jgi:hypothetical protein
MFETTIGFMFDEYARLTLFVPFPKFVVLELTSMLLEEVPNLILEKFGVTESTKTDADPALAVYVYPRSRDVTDPDWANDKPYVLELESAVTFEF